MRDDLKQMGNNTALKRSICGVFAAGAICVIAFLNLFGISEEALDNWKWIALAMLALTVIAFVINWIKVSRTSLMSGIEKYCNTTPNPEATMMRLERTWRDGYSLGKFGRIDNEYLIILDGMSSKVISLKDAVWAYKSVHKYRATAHPALLVIMRDGKRIGCARGYQAPRYIILEFILKNCPDIALGYTKSAQELHDQSDLLRLREYANYQRTQPHMDSFIKDEDITGLGWGYTGN